MSRPVAVDLFCCSGGATRGLQRAGFYVIGVDNKPRPNYCGDDFFEKDALDFIRGGLRGVDLVSSSPPCQEGSALMSGTHGNRPNPHPQLVPETRELLARTGLPFWIEQPTSNRRGLIRRDLTLCMDMFPIEPPRVFRHRSFELSGFTVPQPQHVKHTGRVRGWRHGVEHAGDYVAAYGSGGGKATVPEMRHALGIDWTDVREELTEAIPPTYAEYIGREFLRQAA